MNKIETIKLYNIKETSLLVVLDSIELEKTMRYHDLFLLWTPNFKKMGIPIYLIFPDSKEKLHKSNQIYNMYIHYVSDPILIDRLNCTKEKFVFGKKYNVIFPRMYVVHDHYLSFEQKRINNEMIKKLYLKVIEIKFEKFIKKIKNSVDIPNILW